MNSYFISLFLEIRYPTADEIVTTILDLQMQNQDLDVALNIERHADGLYKDFFIFQNKARETVQYFSFFNLKTSKIRIRSCCRCNSFIVFAFFGSSLQQHLEESVNITRLQCRNKLCSKNTLI